MAPKLVFLMRDPSGRVWKIPAILGLRICLPCRRQLEGKGAEEFMVDGGAKLVESFERMRSGAKHAGTKLEWVSCDSREFKMLDSGRSN